MIDLAGACAKLAPAAAMRIGPDGDGVERASLVAR
jgi:hypothetical protein